MIEKIEHLGKTYIPKEPVPLICIDEYMEICAEWYSKPSYEQVQIEMNDIKRGGVTISNITKYYFRDLMDNTQKYFDKWSINEVFDSRELLSVFVNKVVKNKKVFTSDNICDNLDTAFRLGGKGIASKVSQFPLKVIDEILEKYNVNGNYYDFSCGWGCRLTSAMKHNINYYGTDPNYLLVEKLNQYAEDFKKTTYTKCETKIFLQGSEKFIPELAGKIGLAFSSPPYFNLEDYRIGDQSYKQGTTYEQWIENYLKPTFENIYKYLTSDGYFIINIKDFNGITLEKDTVKTAESVGFELYKIERLSQCNRISGSISGENKMVESDENIYVFIKKGAIPKICHIQQLGFEI